MTARYQPVWTITPMQSPLAWLDAGCDRRLAVAPALRLGRR